MADFQDDPANLAFRRLISFALALPPGYVKPANQSLSPAGSQVSPFASVLVESLVGMGQDQFSERTDPLQPLNLLEEHTGMYHAVVVVQFFRLNATAYARTLKGALERSDSVAYMQAQNIGLISVAAAVDITSVVDTFFEQRARVKFEAYITLSQSLSVPTYDTFPVTVKTETTSSTNIVSAP